MRISLSILSSALAFSSLHAAYSEEFWLKRINANFLIQDYQTASQEAAEAHTELPQSKALFEAYIRAAAYAGEERLCLATWKKYLNLYPLDEEQLPEIIEDIAWGIIYKATSSNAPPLRLMGMLAGFLSQDAKGIALLLKGLHDQNALVRAAAVKLSGHMHDAILRDEVAHLVRTEKSWKVRIEAVQAAGHMKLSDSRPDLLAIASDSSVHVLERTAAIGALVEMQKKISRKALSRLVNDERAGMRMLACQIIAHLELRKDLDLLMPLLSDYSAEVRARALHAIGTLRQPIDTQKGLVVKLLEDDDPSVAIAAAWVVTLNAPSLGQQALEHFLRREDPEVQRLAAAALVAAGGYGLPLLESAFETTQDPYIRLNLALGMVRQRRKTEQAAQAIFEGLESLQEQIMEREDGLFVYIAPSTIRHDELIPNYPEAVNQKNRLELLNVLAVLKYPQALDAIKQFLQQKKWGLSGLASAVLLTEGDDEALSLVKQLLSDANPSVRQQAALVIALWGEDEEALSVLQESYQGAEYEEKEKIIEGIGRIGSKKAIPFLLERLQEPHQGLRVIAAAGLLEALYR